MATYGIVVVPLGWDNHTILSFARDEYKAWQKHFQPGTRVLIYESSPIDAVIGEVEVLEHVESDREAAFSIVPNEQQSYLAQEAKAVHDTAGLMAARSTMESKGEGSEVYRLPVRIIHRRCESRIPQTAVREVTGIDLFPREGEVWLPVDRDTYRALARNWI